MYLHKKCTFFLLAVHKRLDDYLIVRAKYPDHKFIGEESTAANDDIIPEFTNAPTWIIDPIDGTMNFVHRYGALSC